MFGIKVSITGWFEDCLAHYTSGFDYQDWYNRLVEGLLNL